MNCLGIESTAHTFSCAIIQKNRKSGKILSDVRKIYQPPDGQGIHPREASRHHIENSSKVLSQCFDEAKIRVDGNAYDSDGVIIFGSNTPIVLQCKASSEYQGLLKVPLKPITS